MTLRRSSVLAAILLTIVVAGNTRADVRREKTERRPYITEIGEPYSISLSTLRHEAERIHELREYVGDYGEPDYAEIQEIDPTWPWESHEVRLYYLRRNLEVDFGHVLLSAAMPNMGLLKFRGDIQPEKRHQIEVILQARQAPPPAPVAAAAPPTGAPPVEAPPAVAPAEQPHAGGLTEALVARIEAAAERAAQAADRAAEQSEAAARAADRTVTLVDKMEQSASARRR